MTRNESTRDSILEAALRVFTEIGYYESKISDIVKAAGVAQGTFYLYFKNKESVFSALLETHMNSVARQYERLLGPVFNPGSTRDEILEILTEAIQTVYRMACEKRCVLAMIYKQGIHIPEVAKMIREFEESEIRFIQQLMLRFPDCVEMSQTEQEVMANGIRGTYWEVSMKMFIFGDYGEKDVPLISRTVANMILHMTMDVGDCLLPKGVDEA